MENKIEQNHAQIEMIKNFELEWSSLVPETVLQQSALRNSLADKI